MLTPVPLEQIVDRLWSSHRWYVREADRLQAESDNARIVAARTLEEVKQAGGRL